MLPAERLEDEGNGLGPATPKEDCVDGDPPGVLPVRIQVGAAEGGRAEAGVGVGCRVRCLLGGAQLLPVLHIEPGGDASAGGRLILQPLPEHTSIRRGSHVGEYRVGLDGSHGVGVRLHIGPGRHTKETILGVDGPEPTVRTKSHPRNVVPYQLRLPPGKAGGDHGQVGLAALAGEGGSYVPLHTLRVGQTENLAEGEANKMEGEGEGEREEK